MTVATWLSFTQRSLQKGSNHELAWFKVRRSHTNPVTTISKALIFAVTYIASAPAESEEREDADVEALEQIGALLQAAQPAELAALRANVDEAIATERNSDKPDLDGIRNYEAFIESYLPE